MRVLLILVLIAAWMAIMVPGAEAAGAEVCLYQGSSVQCIFAWPTSCLVGPYGFSTAGPWAVSIEACA